MFLSVSYDIKYQKVAKKCHAIKQGMVFRYTSARGFIPKKIQWHIHAGSWSLVNCLAGSL